MTFLFEPAAAPFTAKEENNKDDESNTASIFQGGTGLIGVFGAQGCGGG